MNYLQKFFGCSINKTETSSISDILFAYIGSFIAISIIGYCTQSFDILFVIGSFGASCVLIFAFPNSPFSQPKNVIVGHGISTFVGLIFLHLLGSDWWSMALALSTAIAIMLFTKTVHPPAGSNPLIVFLIEADFEYLFFPTLSGAIILVFVATIYINLHPRKIYPQYWV